MRCFYITNVLALNGTDKTNERHGRVRDGHKQEVNMYKSRLIHLPLQFFAEGDPAQGDNNSAEGTNTEPTPTFDDMIKSNKEMQAEFDRRMTKAQETALAKAKAEWEAQAQAEKEEAAKLAKMNAEEKAKHEREKQEKALAEREAAVSKRELTAEAISQLGEKGLPVELSACLNYSDAESCKVSMEAVEKAFNAAVEKRVNDMLRGTPPKAGQAEGTPVINNIRDAIIYEQKKNGGN